MSRQIAVGNPNTFPAIDSIDSFTNSINGIGGPDAPTAPDGIPHAQTSTDPAGQQAPSSGDPPAAGGRAQTSADPPIPHAGQAQGPIPRQIGINQAEINEATNAAQHAADIENQVQAHQDPVTQEFRA